MADTHPTQADDNWWRGAVIYQVYPRSFADGNGDGTGDLAGVRAHLPYLAELGVDALWFSPWYPSPLADGGYDVADYRDIDPMFGTLAEAEKLIAEALDLGIRTIVDIVPNHVSDAHPWFREALAAGPGSPERERFWFRPGRGEHGELPPNNWPSQFGGPAWTRTKNDDGTPASGTCTCSTPSSPTSTGTTRRYGPSTRTCCGSGSTGARRAYASTRPPCSPRTPRCPTCRSRPGGRRPCRIRTSTATTCTTSTAPGARIADAYPGARVLIGEVWMPDIERFARYLRPDELHTAFNFDFLTCPWEPARLRAVHRHHARRARAGRRARHLGAVQPRRDPHGDPLRPGGQRLRLRHQGATASPPTWRWAPGGPAPRPC